MGQELPREKKKVKVVEVGKYGFKADDGNEYLLSKFNKDVEQQKEVIAGLESGAEVELDFFKSSNGKLYINSIEVAQGVASQKKQPAQPRPEKTKPEPKKQVKQEEQKAEKKEEESKKEYWEQKDAKINRMNSLGHAIKVLEIAGAKGSPLTIAEQALVLAEQFEYAINNGFTLARERVSKLRADYEKKLQQKAKMKRTATSYPSP